MMEINLQEYIITKKLQQTNNQGMLIQTETYPKNLTTVILHMVVCCSKIVCCNKMVIWALFQRMIQHQNLNYNLNYSLNYNLSLSGCITLWLIRLRNLQNGIILKCNMSKQIRYSSFQKNINKNRDKNYILEVMISHVRRLNTFLVQIINSLTKMDSIKNTVIGS